MLEKTVEIPEIGTVLLVSKPSLRRLSLRVMPNGTVRVIFPPSIAEQQALNFVNQQAAWIQKQQNKRKEQREVFALNQQIKTPNRQISIVQGTQPKMHAGISNTNVVICIPPQQSVETDESQRFIRKVLAEVLRQEAKIDLPERVSRWANQFGLKYQTVTIKKLKSKWGSCSSMGNINLNLNVMRLPEHLIDYIVLHELAHTREMNHGPRFWGFLGVLLAKDPKPIDRELKKYGHLIL
jgi:predicted metal-dependent hydrolase